MIPVGYLVKRSSGLYGERGTFYDYILAGNGVWVEAEGPLMAARVPVAVGEIRGLEPLEPRVVLRHGPIPGRLWELALNVMMADTTQERYIGISREDAQYRLHVPEQERSGAGVRYVKALSSIVLDLHSHCGMRAFFSGTDDQDEQGLRLYGVVGRLPERPQVRLRVGVYGYFYPIPWVEVFSGSLAGVADSLDETDYLEEPPTLLEVRPGPAPKSACSGTCSEEEAEMKRGDLVTGHGYYGIVLRVGESGRLQVFWGNGLVSTESEKSTVKPVLLPNSQSPATFHEILKEGA